MTATVHTIIDLLVANLQTKFSSGEWNGYGQVEVEAMIRPSFKLEDATDTTLIKIAAYPDVRMRRLWRDKVESDLRIGIGFIKKIEMTDGKPDENAGRILMALAEQIYQWAFTGPEGYEHDVISVGLPAQFDAEKEKQGIFVTAIPITYRVGFLVTA